MAYKGVNSKIVSDPISGLIDIGPVLPLVETRAFQALADKRQLGMTYLVYRGATHTRFNHCLGAYHATKELMNRWFLQGVVTDEERRAVPVYALLHDIGHPAFSHVTEDFCPTDDDEMTLNLIHGELRETISRCGVDFRLVENLATHENPLYLAVHDKNLGMEKLDYLERDGLYTLLSRPSGITFLREYIYFVRGQICIDEKVVEYTLEVLNFYIQMYKEVYFRKSLVIAQRMFHKAVYHLVLSGELLPVELPSMTDSELIGLMYRSRDSVVQTLYYRLRERHLFREAVVVRSEDFVDETRVANKPIAVIGVSPAQMDTLVNSPVLQKGNHVALEELEKKLASVAGVPEGHLLVVPVFNPERFKAKDVLIYGSDGELHSLRERRPQRFASMEETARSYSALRICVPEEYRVHVSSASVSQKLLDFILSVS